MVWWLCKISGIAPSIVLSSTAQPLADCFATLNLQLVTIDCSMPPPVSHEYHQIEEPFNLRNPNKKADVPWKFVA